MDRRITDTPEIDWAKYPIPRVRHHVNSQAYFPAEQHHRLPAWYPPANIEPDWGSWFKNGLPPSVLDIGCGRGAFLLRHALANPTANILGLEVRKPLVDYINEVALGEQLPNAHAEWYSAVNGLRFIPSGSVEYAVYLFPDPWPKKRHHKRRAFSAEFLSELHRVLVPQGLLYLATDREEVDLHQRAVLGASELFSVSNPLGAGKWPFDFATDQEMFCHSKGIPYVQYYAQRRA